MASCDIQCLTAIICLKLWHSVQNCNMPCPIVTFSAKLCHVVSSCDIQRKSLTFSAKLWHSVPSSDNQCKTVPLCANPWPTVPSFDIPCQTILILPECETRPADPTMAAFQRAAAVWALEARNWQKPDGVGLLENCCECYLKQGKAISGKLTE